MSAILVENGTILSRDQIVGILHKHNVDWRKWGEKTSRTLDDLCQQHANDQLDFRNSSSSKLIIDVHAAIVIIVHQYKKGWLELYEDRQIFPDGHILRRVDFNGIAETLKRGEFARDGAIRCLAEELKFRDPSKYELAESIVISTSNGDRENNSS